MIIIFCQNIPLIYAHMGCTGIKYEWSFVVTRGQWTLHVKKLRQCPIFTKLGTLVCFDETKRKVNYKFFVRGQEKVTMGQNIFFHLFAQNASSPRRNEWWSSYFVKIFQLSMHIWGALELNMNGHLWSLEVNELYTWKN